MKAVAFHADAEAELIEAAVYYEAQRHDLGKRFLASVQDAINRIVFNPLLYHVIELDVRRCLHAHFLSVFYLEIVQTISR